jgi:dihydrofolate reductase
MTQVDRSGQQQATGKVIWEASMSLDGFIAGPGHALDWIFEHTESDPALEEVMHSAGAMLGGRRTYDSAPREEQEAYGGAWDGRLFVLTHQPPADPDPRVTFLTGDLRDAVATALDAAGGKNLVVAGADIPRQCIQAGLIDEIVVHVVPVLLGDGVRLFGDPPASRAKLEKVSVTESGKITNLRFRVVQQQPS